MSDKKLCPLFVAAVVMALKYSTLSEMQEASVCMKGSCAWWNEERKVCGMRQ